MQKLAVALTTQEEFNEYMDWRKDKLRCSFSISDDLFTDGLGDIGVAHYEMGGRIRLNDKMYKDYKIISLQEAIGEKEDKELQYNCNKCGNNYGTRCQDCIDKAKEDDTCPDCRGKGYCPDNNNCILCRGKGTIIGEGEARLKKYKHKTLGREAKQMDDKPNYYYIYKQLGKGAMSASKTSREADFPNREIVYCIDKQLIENSSDWEPIEEPKRDWIDEVINHLVSIHGRLIESNNNEIREAIEKHMPRITEKELDNISWEIKTVQQEKRVTNYGELLELLKSKGLLE